ncbi:MAG: acyl-CoA desaturase [Gammaproteobacteria bacterium]|nr:acyl-CoA desaturase [Gammaproteobacteria bacterium]
MKQHSMTNAKPILSNTLFFSITFGITVIGVPLYAWAYGFDQWQILITILLLGYAGMSITMGYHRLWSHRTFDAHPAVRFILAIGGALAVQNSILHWSSDHREHHKHVDDNIKDPYSAKRGFWYSHIGWMLREYQPDRYYDYANVKDLQKDPIVMWQHRHYWPLAWGVNIGLTGALGLLLGDLPGTLLLAGVARLTLSQHFTFFINSLAHIWGRQPYSHQNTSKDNPVIALLTYGEGYHNFHHRFASDYRNGIRWWQFDPTKWTIKLLSLVGLTKNLRRYADERIERAKALLQMNEAKSRFESFPNADEFVVLLQSEYELLLSKMSEFYAAKKALLESRQPAGRNIDPGELSRRYAEVKAGWRRQRRHWKQLVALPAPA